MNSAEGIRRVVTRPEYAVRFWNRVARSECGCWPWMSAKDPHGYGRYTEARVQAHRIAWAFDHGVPSSETVIRHTCDNPPCCNPAHLVAGSQADNMHDMIQRGRKASTSGSRHARARMVETDVRWARLMHKDGMSPTILAKLFSVSVDNMTKTLSGAQWKNVT